MNHSFIYIDHLAADPSTFARLPNTTIVIVLTYSQVHFISKVRNQGQQVRDHIEKGLYPIDSITTTVSTLLGIPIPFENHGVLLPGLIFKLDKQEIDEVQ